MKSCRRRKISTYLVRENGGAKVTKRELEPSVITLDVDLESDHNLRRGGHGRCHGCCYDVVSLSLAER